MEILRATAEDLAAILKLQYLAFQSEAMQVGSSDIQPLTQSLDKLAKEFDRGMIYKALDRNGRIVGSVRGYLTQ